MEELEAGHDLVQISVKNPTCMVPGSFKFKCTKCGTIVTEDIPVTDHYFVETEYIYPTCTEEGVSIGECLVCHTENIVYSPAYGHNYVDIGGGNIQCSRCGDIQYTTGE